jgi:hypothetical protein
MRHYAPWLYPMVVLALQYGITWQNGFLFKNFWSLAKDIIGVGLRRHNAKKFTHN